MRLYKIILLTASICFPMYALLELVQVIRIPSNDTHEQQQLGDIFPTQVSQSLIHIHYVLGHGEIGTEDDAAIVLVAALEKQVRLNIVHLLALSDDRRYTLDTYLTQSRQLLSRTDSEVRDIQFTINDAQLVSSQCVLEKQQADDDYFDALAINNTAMIQDALNQSQQAEECIGKNRIFINSQQAILTKINFFARILDDTYRFVSERKDLIIQYFPVMHENLLQQLLQITTRLDSLDE